MDVEGEVRWRYACFVFSSGLFGGYPCFVLSTGLFGGYPCFVLSIGLFGGYPCCVFQDGLFGGSSQSAPSCHLSHSKYVLPLVSGVCGNHK